MAVQPSVCRQGNSNRPFYTLGIAKRSLSADISNGVRGADTTDPRHFAKPTTPITRLKPEAETCSKAVLATVAVLDRAHAADKALHFPCASQKDAASVCSATVLTH
jgi:hypothetical protein